MLPALLFKTPADLTLVTIESGNFSRRVSDCQWGSFAAECSHTVSLATHVLPVWQTCPQSASNREQRSRPAVPAVRLRAWRVAQIHPLDFLRKTQLNRISFAIYFPEFLSPRMRLAGELSETD